jgi:hypothetical protein
MQVSARLDASNDTFFDATSSIYQVQHLQSRMTLGSEHWVLARLLLGYLSVACRLVKGLKAEERVGPFRDFRKASNHIDL